MLAPGWAHFARYGVEVNPSRPERPTTGRSLGRWGQPGRAAL